MFPTSITPTTEARTTGRLADKSDWTTTQVAAWDVAYVGDDGGTYTRRFYATPTTAQLAALAPNRATAQALYDAAPAVTKVGAVLAAAKLLGLDS